MAFDSGPTPTWLTAFNQAPLAHYVTHPKKRFRFQFGPVYYRGRLDGTARVLVIGQDPSTNELLAQRTFVGQSGQRVQRLLAKLGITRSYLMLNTFLFPVFGQFDTELRNISLEQPIITFRNLLLDKAKTDNTLQAIILMGAAPKHAYDNWTGRPPIPAFFLTHPAAADTTVLVDWNKDLQAMAAAITPDTGGVVNTTPYGTKFTSADIAAIPDFDMPFGTPDWQRDGGGRSTRDGDNKIIWESPLI